MYFHTVLQNISIKQIELLCNMKEIVHGSSKLYSETIFKEISSFQIIVSVCQSHEILQKDKYMHYKISICCFYICNLSKFQIEVFQVISQLD